MGMRGKPVGKWAVWGLMAYLVLSIATLPIVDALWLDEIPLLAIIQLPKLNPAGFVRVEIVMPAIKAMGLSKGSFSPDYGMAGPYALLLVYLVPALALAFYALVSKGARATPRAIALLVATLVLLCLDYAFTLYFATGPGFTMY